MKAYILKNTGWIENLVLQDIPTPTPAAGEVVIETKAISINPVDAKVRANTAVLSMICGVESDVILWRDVAWVVTAVWDDVTEYAIWDKVFGMVNFPWVGNAYATHIAAPAAHITKIPANTSYPQAAASTLAALTALQALQWNVKQWDRVLIHAWSGWVGHFAIQIAKHLGAHVITTCSAANRDFVLWLWADKHIDYRETAFETEVSDIDFVLDTLGGENIEKCLLVTKKWGKVISLPAPVPEETQASAQEKEINASFMLVTSDKTDIETIADYLEKWIITPHLSQTFDFDDMWEAHVAIESWRTVGKIVVKSLV